MSNSTDGCPPLDFSEEILITVDPPQFTISASTGCLTIAGNLLSICLIANIMRRKREARNGSTMYLLALASSDFLQAIFVYPIHIAAQKSGRWVGGYGSCMLMAFCGNFFYLLSALIVTILAVVRLFATKNPLGFRHYLKRNKLWASILANAILVSAILSALPFTPLGCIAFHASGAICSYHWYTTGVRNVSTVAILLSQGLMLIVIISCTIGTIVCLQWQGQGHRGDLRRMERNFSLGVVAIATVQIICWGPFVVWQSFSRASGVNVPLAAMIVGYLTLFVSVFNPIVFACMMKPYRADCCRLIRFILCCRRSCHYDIDSDDSSRARKLSNTTSHGKAVIRTTSSISDRKLINVHRNSSDLSHSNSVNPYVNNAPHVNNAPYVNSAPHVNNAPYANNAACVNYDYKSRDDTKI